MERKVKNLILIMTILASTGCSFLSAGHDHPHQASVDAPEPIQVDDGSYLYIPNYVADEFGAWIDGEIKAQCTSAEIVSKEVKPREVEEQPIGFAYDTVEREYDFVFQTHEPIDVAVMNADHIHIESAEIYSSSGDKLDFIEWIRVHPEHYGNPMIGWSPNPTGWVFPLRIDGSIDLKPYMKYQDDGDGYITVKSKARGKSPDRDTYIGTRFNLLLFRDCE